MEAPGRKQARSKSFLTRKSSKKQPEAKPKGGFRSASLDMQEKEQDIPRPLFNPFAISLIPDPLNELPSWYHREVESATASAAQFRVKYPLHNPFGPRWYRNHHLLPLTRDGRPPSVFSPSFPPMASAPERAQDPSRMAGPSRTPSGSPLPTPSSSQIRIQEPFKPRSRKVSQNTPDNVDILDDADPFSPLSLSLSPSPYDEKVEPESPVSPGPTSPNHYNNRPRRASVNYGTRHRTMAPSPLSQSTSAVHLHVLDPSQIQMPRKLSKRRKPFNGLFGPDGQTDALRRQSTMTPSMTSLPSLQTSMQKPKRGSILGRLVKRFSVLRKPEKAPTQNGYGTERAHVGGSAQPSPVHTPTSPQSPEDHHRASSRLSRSPEPPRRVPAPSIEAVRRESLDHANDTSSRRSADSVSVHELQTSGRLTIANPDYPSSGDDTPVEAPAPLPPTTYVYEQVSPARPSKEDLPLPSIPRTESPMQMDSVRPRFSVQLSDPPVRPPAPPSSPPLPELPPPSPAPMLQTVIEAEYSPANSTVGPPSSPPDVQDTLTQSGSPASTVTPLPRPEDIALARASLFVNPPTPYTAPAPLVIPPSAPVPQGSRQSPSKRVDRSPTKAKDGASRSKSTRQTETFKLVRSPSGTIQQATEVIMGMGEQWEVVETPVDVLSPKKSKLTKDKEKARTKSPEREQPVHREESRRRREHSSSTEEGDSRQKRHPSTSGREKAPSINSVRSTQTPIMARRSTKKTSDIEEGRASKRVSSTPTGATPAQQQTRERHLSASATTRPNSELHSAADLSSVRAKDAWEMERLWKARSMAYGPDGMPIVSTPATIGSDSRPSTFISPELQRVSSIPSVTAVAEIQKASSIPLAAQQMHGSSHTYVVYQGEGHASYAQFASPPPQNPMMSPAQQYNRHSGFGSPDPMAHNPLPSPPRLSTYQRSPLPMSLTNPLPEPPRLSAYQPAPLPASLTDVAGDGARNSWRSMGP